jgi:glycosyltransferase involved in cell wall biosynthesis
MTQYRKIMDNDERSIWVVLPCYNVAVHIQKVIGSIPPYITGIVAVNDASQDGTMKHLEELKSDPRLHILDNQLNLGVGGSTKLGFEYAFSNGADVVVKLDGDGQMDSSLIVDLVQPIFDGRADYVKGNRFIDTDQVISMPKLRLLGNIALSFLTKLSSGYWEIFDPNNGFVAISKKAFSLIPLAKVDNRYFFESDMLFRLHLARAVIQDVPIPTKYGTEVSGLSEARAVFEFSYKHNRNFIKRILIEYYLRDFNLGSLQLPLGLGLCLFGGVYGLTNFIHFQSMNLETPTGTQVLVAMSLLSGLQLLLSFFAFDISNAPKKPIS